MPPLSVATNFEQCPLCNIGLGWGMVPKDSGKYHISWKHLRVNTFSDWEDIKDNKSILTATNTFEGCLTRMSYPRLIKPFAEHPKSHTDFGKCPAPPVPSPYVQTMLYLKHWEGQWHHMQYRCEHPMSSTSTSLRYCGFTFT